MRAMAEAAGLRAGDRIWLIGDTPTTEVEGLQKTLRRIGQDVPMLVMRDGVARTVDYRPPELKVDYPYLILSFIGFLYLAIGLFTLFRGDTVSFVVSLGPELVEVPRVRAMGVEAEFTVMLDGQPVKPEDVFHSPANIVRAPMMHRQGKSYHLPTGGAIYFDTGVIEIATTMISHTEGRVDVDNVDLFLGAFQEGAPLTLGELWAMPAMLRLALIESVRRMALRTRERLGRWSFNTIGSWSDAAPCIARTRP